MPSQLPETRDPRVVIVGGGFGGMTFARELRGKAFQVVLVDRNNYHLFQPLLYQVATSGLEPDSIVFPIRKIFDGQSNFVFRMAEAIGISADRNMLVTTIGEIPYDILVVATGSVAQFFGVTGAMEHGLILKSTLDAMEMRNRVLSAFERCLLSSDIEERDSLMRFVIVGGGPTGVEVAGALAELRKHVLPYDYPELDFRRMRIDLLEAGPRLLAAMSEHASGRARADLENIGVGVWLETALKSYDGRRASLSTGKEILARHLLWTAGVTGSPPEGLRAERNGRVRVDSNGKLLEYSNIYAIGDLALHDPPHPMMAPVAIQQAKHLAQHLGGVHARPFEYRNRGSMATIGRARAVADLAGRSFGGYFAWILWLFVHLAMLMGFRNRLVVFVNWVWSYLSYDRGARIILPLGESGENRSDKTFSDKRG